MKSTTFSCSSVATSQFAAAFAVFIFVAVYVSHAASCSSSLMTTLQIDPSTQLITLATATSTRQAPSVLQTATSSAYLNIRDESADVSAFLCYDSTNVNKTVANYLCTSTFGDGFTASLVTPVAIATSLTSNNTDVATRFPFLVSNATASTTTTAVLSNLLLKLRALSCISHVFNDPSTAIDSAAFSGACSLCSVEALSTCPSLAQITCSAPADIDRANPYAPIVVSSPSQWANATIAFDSQFTAPPAWVPQALCNADISSSDEVVTAVLGAGYGVVGNDAAGYSSGFDALQFAPMQFTLSCSTTSTTPTATSGNDVVSQGCTMTPTVNSSATAVVSAVNMSRAMIVGCSVANRGTPPLLQPSLSRATPSDSCQFVMTPSTSVDVDVTSLAQLSSLQAEASAMLLASSSTVDMYLAAWCPTLPPSSIESSTSASLHRYRVCTTDALWRSMIIPLCRAAGFDGGELQPLLSASQISVADIASNSSGNLSSTLLRLRCPSSYFPTQQINEDFDNCDMLWVPRSSISAVVTATPSTTTSTSSSPCTARYLRCYMVAEQQQERVEWIFGSTLFCIVFVGSMVISTFSLWSERRQLLNANSVTLHRRRSTRLRTRSSKPSDTTSVAMLGLSSADVTNLVLGDTQRNVSLQKKRSSSVMSTEERPLTMTTSSVGKGSGGSSDGGSTYGNSIRDSDVLLLLPAAVSSPPLLPPQQSPRFAIPRGGEVEL